MTDLESALASDTLQLVDIASESRDERAIIDAIGSRIDKVAGLRVVRGEDVVVAALPARRAGMPLVLLAGHVDTVPLGGAAFPATLDGDVVSGRGAADMKGGLAVMLRLAEEDAASDAVDVGYLFFGREEVPINESALLPAFERWPELRDAALAIVLEPTANRLEVGCNGNLNARVTVSGTAAHSARPWLGDNAIHNAIEALAAIADLPVRDVDVDGLVFREVVSVTRIEGGGADNVVPDTVHAHVNLRYAPSHTPTEAEARLRELVEHDGVAVEIVGNAPPGRVCLDNPLVERLRTTGELHIGPKQGWTPVAEFGIGGVDAVNLGPGDPRYAHSDDEQVSGTALARTHEIVSAFLAGRKAEVGPSLTIDAGG